MVKDIKNYPTRQKQIKTYSRVKNNKVEQVKKHVKEVHVKPELVNEKTKKKIIKGKATQIISFDQAKEHFKNQPERNQNLDLARTNQRTLKKGDISSEYLSEKGTGKFDVEGIDTPDAPVIKREELENAVDKIMTSADWNKNKFYGDINPEYFKMWERKDSEKKVAIYCEDSLIGLKGDGICYMTFHDKEERIVYGPKERISKQEAWEKGLEEIKLKYKK